MNKDELLLKIRSSRQRLEEALANIRADQMDRVILHGQWSVRDMVGHICFWEDKLLSLYDILSSGGIPEALGDIDVLNANALEKYKSKPLQSILDGEMEAYKKILQLVNQAKEAELFEPGYFSWMNGHSFAEFISDNTYLHYDEHLIELTAWMKRVA